MVHLTKNNTNVTIGCDLMQLLPFIKEESSYLVLQGVTTGERIFHSERSSR